MPNGKPYATQKSRDERNEKSVNFKAFRNGYMKNLQIKTVSVNDLPLLFDLFKYKKKAGMIKENTQKIENGEIDVFGLFKGNRVIGELRVKYKSNDEQEVILGKRVYLYAFRVLKKYQGKGYGKFLLQEVISRLYAKGYSEFTVGVEDDNARAIHVYKEFGFHCILAGKYEEYEGYGYAYDLYLKAM